MNKKVVLYSPLTSLVLEQKQPPLALLAVSKLLYKNRYEIVIITRNEENYKEKIIKELKDSVCLGITTMTGFQIEEGLKIAKLVKKAYPDKTIVWGGWHPSILPQQTIEHPLVDIVVYGQGERTFLELAEALYNKKNLRNVDGLVFKKGNGEFITTPPRKTEPMDNFPPLPYELLDMNKFIINSEIGTRSSYYITSYGCPFRCGFCADKIVYKRKWIALSAERVVEDIKNLARKYNINGLFISDSNFFVDENRVVEICKGLIKENLNVNLGYINGRADQLNRYKNETFELMQKANFKSILIGAESPTQEILDYITKDEKVEDIVELTKRCKKYGMKIYFSLILGLPPRAEEKENYNKYLKKEFEKMLSYIDELMKIDDKNVFAICIYTPYPGSSLYEKAVENGFVPPKSFEEWSNFEVAKQNMPWFPKEYQKLIDQLNLLYFPFMSDSVYEIYKNSLIFGFFYKGLRFILKKRWKYRFFHIPIEYYMLRFILKFKMKSI